MKTKTANCLTICFLIVLVTFTWNGEAYRLVNIASASVLAPAQSSGSSKSLSAQPIWQRLDFPILPPPRTNFALTYNPTNRILLVFGGHTPIGVINDFWLTNGRQWMEFHTPHTPKARANAGMAYDEARQNAILFGGADDMEFFSDTWLYNGIDWAELHPLTSPAPRGGMSLAYNPVQKVTYLFGGYFSKEKDYNVLGDMWAWDGANWQQQFPAILPLARSNGLMVFDPARQNMILFGGSAAAAPLQDTWIWDGITWVEQLPLHHPSYYFVGSGMTFDERSQQVILFGIDFDFHGEGEHTETWAWDGKVWTELQTIQVPPLEVARGAELVYLPELQTVMLFNRYVNKTSDPETFIERSEVWALDFRYLTFLPEVQR